VVAGEVRGHAAGLVRIQDEGSQLIAELAGRGSAILDCCAAPGGKTAILAERNPTATITACDISPRRLKAMQAALGRQPGIRFRVLDATELPFSAAIRPGALRRSLQRNRNHGAQPRNKAPDHRG
jgi:16S rRNA (cytosine967-C5)-methyltransferase